MTKRRREMRLWPAIWFLAAGAGVFATAATSPEVTNQEVKQMERQGHHHHQIDYIELTVTDMVAAKSFYAAAFGWEFNEYGPEYSGIRAGEGEAGGLRLESEASTGGPLVVLYSNDLEQSLANVRQAEGRIVTEPFEFPGGRRFHFRDPSGNELAVWSER